MDDDESALRATVGPGWRRHSDRSPIRIAVDESRKVVPVAGCLVRRAAGFDAKVQWNLGPPRVRVEEAALGVAARARTEFGAIALLADVCQSRDRSCRTAGKVAVLLSQRGWTGTARPCGAGCAL